MRCYDAKDLQPFVNVGNGRDISIKDLAFTIKDLVGYGGEIIFDSAKPDGMPKKLLDTSRSNSLGWTAKTSIEEGLRKTYDAYLRQLR
jgi:GDP-L-fucose synthase